MPLTLIGKKRGMLQLFEEVGEGNREQEGFVIPCTVIEVEPNVITQIKSAEKDGYVALQLASDEIRCKDERTLDKRVAKPQRGLFAKVGVRPRRHLREARLDSIEGYQVGQFLSVALFSDIPYVDVTAMSKGKGYQGLMKRKGFRGGPKSHGSGFHRHAGSTGMRSTPGRCLPGGPRPSQMGYDRVTVQSLRVVRVDVERNLIVVKGAIPGPRNGIVYLSPAVKKREKAGTKKK